VQETGTLFSDDLLLEQDLCDGGERACLPGTLIGGLAEAERALGVEGISATARAARGFFAVLRTLDNGRKRQKIYHLGQLAEVTRAVEASRTADIYLGNATYASARSRQATNVRALQVAWVDVDCYTLGLEPTPELVEKLVERARFAGVPAPTHIVCSGRGLYLKWLLEAPVSDSDLKPWGMLQAGLSALYRDIGADFSAIDSARVLRIVGSRNSKVDAAASARRADPSMVGVVWDSARRHRFQDLCVAVAQLDLNLAAPKRERAKPSHHAALAGMGEDSSLPPELRGNLKFLEAFGRDLHPNLDLEAQARSEGKNGMSGVTLGWHRFLDLRDLFLRRAEARGATGIEEGSRDLAMLWMVNFLAQARMVRSSNVLREVEMLMPAFAGVGVPGPRGFEPPSSSGALDTLVAKMKAAEAGKRVRFGGGLWDPKYTPSNDYLINLFGITGDEMKGLRTIIDSSEKRCRADSKVPGRAQRREVRESWQAAALRMRADLCEPSAAQNQPAVPARKLNAHIAKAHGVNPEQLRRFFKTHDAALALKEARKKGEAPLQMRRTTRPPPTPAAPVPSPSLEPVAQPPHPGVQQAKQQEEKGSASLQAFRRRGYTGPDEPGAIRAWISSLRQEALAAAGTICDLSDEEAKEAKSKAVYEGVLARISQRLEATRAELGPVADALPAGPDAPAAPDPSGSVDLNVAPSLLVPQFHREQVIPRENAKTNGISMPATIESRELTASGAQRPKASKRDLLNRARKAQLKEPLLSGVPEAPKEGSPQGDLLQLDQGSAPAPVAQDLGCTAASASSQETSKQAIAINVIPADLPGDWTGGGGALRYDDVPDDAEPAGMPDFDDSYLDSQVPTGVHARQAEAPAQAPAPVAPRPSALPRGFTASATAASAPPAAGKVLSFARPAAHAPAAPAAARPSFGTLGHVPQAQPPAPSGSPSLKGTAANRPRAGASPVAPAAPAGGAMGFGLKPAMLSADQARINGQNVDFAKLFEDPSYDANGVPVGYPRAAAWPEDDLPAGSNYSIADWAAARVADPTMLHGHIVVEIQVGNPIRSALLQIPRVAPKDQTQGDGAGGGLRVVNGKVFQAEPSGGMEDWVADVLADTIIVSRKSPVDSRWRGAVEGGIEQMRGGVSSYFRIIRPRAHFADPQKLLFINAKLQVNGSFGEAGARVVPPQDGADEPGQSDDAEGQDAPRG
jgi:hypothetical protein